MKVWRKLLFVVPVFAMLCGCATVGVQQSDIRSTISGKVDKATMIVVTEGKNGGFGHFVSFWLIVPDQPEPSRVVARIGDSRGELLKFVHFVSCSSANTANTLVSLLDRAQKEGVTVVVKGHPQGGDFFLENVEFEFGGNKREMNLADVVLPKQDRK